ncbi:MAG: hypothetical protein OXT65_01890, partial [Alphaproteobacteria bacterium]|nr:hypothetical protein [Alphaproteobacteria bacterium]
TIYSPVGGRKVMERKHKDREQKKRELSQMWSEYLAYGEALGAYSPSTTQGTTSQRPQNSAPVKIRA